MAQIILSGDGLTLEIEDEIARSDELLRRALSPHYPEIANALITREEKDGVLKVTVAKRAGPKGADGGNEEAAGKGGATRRVVAELEAASAYLNPALVLAWQLGYLEANSSGNEAQIGVGGITLEKQLALQPTISEALLEGKPRRRRWRRLSSPSKQLYQSLPGWCHEGFSHAYNNHLRFPATTSFAHRLGRTKAPETLPAPPNFLSG